MNHKGVLVKEIQRRACLILEEFNNLINKTKLDPILEIFRTNEMLQEFYMKRIFEIIREYLSNEKERYIEAILSENEHFKNVIDNQNKEIILLKEKLNEVSKIKEKILMQEKNNQEKEKQIKEMKNNNERLSRELQESKDRYDDFARDYKNFRQIQEHIIEENSILKTKINLLEIKVDEEGRLGDYCRELKEEVRVKEEHLDFFKENMNQMKNKHEDFKCKVDLLIRENEKLKKETVDKDLIVEEFVNKIKGFKLEFQKQEEVLRTSQEHNEKLQETIDNVLKVKIKALKSKLKEKLDLLSQKEREFNEYKTEKENLLSKIFSKK